ncbi:MAG: DNA repair protein RecO [Phycisphaerales bacterium JB037]
MAAEPDEAVCLRAWEWSETSQTVALLTRRGGVLRALAKGSRREKAPYSGGFEPLTLGEVLVIRKPADRLSLVTEWELRETFPAIRARYDAFEAGMYMAEASLQGVSEGDPHPRVFEALIAGLRRLDRSPRVAAAWFLWKLLVDLGVGLDLERDVRADAPLDLDRSLVLDPRAGGFTRVEDDSIRSRWGVRAETVERLRDLSRAEPESLERLDAPGTRRALRLLDAYLATVLGRPLVSSGWLDLPEGRGSTPE